MYISVLEDDGEARSRSCWCLELVPGSSVVA
jgi:hypothetical protein